MTRLTLSALAMVLATGLARPAVGAEPPPIDSTAAVTSESAEIGWRAAPPPEPALSAEDDTRDIPAGSFPEFNLGGSLGAGPDVFAGRLELRVLLGPTRASTRTAVSLHASVFDEADTGDGFEPNPVGFPDFASGAAGLSIGRRHFFQRTRLTSMVIGAQAGLVGWDSDRDGDGLNLSLDGHLGVVTGPAYLELQANTIPGKTAWAAIAVGLRFGQW
jgi:hypothetical protein